MALIKKAVFLFTLLIVAFILINFIDQKPSELTKVYLQKADSLKSNSGDSFFESFYKDLDEKELKKDARNPKLRCFIETTCSNEDLTDAVIEAKNVIKRQQDSLQNFKGWLLQEPHHQISKDSWIKESTAILQKFSFIRLQLIEINLLFHQLEYDQATSLALNLDSFLIRSLGSPNSLFTASILMNALKSLRLSLQKNSPKRLQLKKVDISKVLEDLKLAEFIIFKNTMYKLKYKPSTASEKALDAISLNYPAFFLSINRTLNLYTKNLEDGSHLSSRYSLINPLGLAFLQIFEISPQGSERLRVKAESINSLNL